MTHRRTLALFAAIAALALAPSTASAWAPADSATVHPGVQTVTEGSGQCTSNFVYTSGADVYLGQAAHCSGTGAATETDGCRRRVAPAGHQVEIDRRQPARHASPTAPGWRCRATTRADANACAYNDLALVKVDPADVGKVNPSVPGFGGPTGSTATVANAADVYSYGNSSLRAGVTTRPQAGQGASAPTGGGWSHTVYTATPGIPGDSGSGFFDAQGRPSAR